MIELPKYLKDEQEKMIVDMRKMGYSLQNVADIFGVEKSYVYRMCKAAGIENKKEEDAD